MILESLNEQVKTENSNWIETCDSLTILIKQIIATGRIDRGDVKRTALATLFCKIINSFFSASILLRCGYAQDAGTIVRSLIEALFVMKACHESAEYLDQYMRTDIKVLDKVHQKHSTYVERMKIKGLMTDDDSLAHKDAHEKAMEVYEGQSGVELNIARAAEVAKLQDMYDIIYIHLSTMNSHPSVRSLGSRMTLDDGGGLKEFNVGPDHKGVDWMFSILIQPVIITLECMDKELSIGISSEIRASWESYNKAREALVS
ncbi:MAG: hypothetical protein FD177_58 [Desulfovibrionaceae bacterium]|nr:MAG: hypothetical protein FD177_58 [Desulfovibrionaceae bacterium]